jgi:hypothetical protein
LTPLEEQERVEALHRYAVLNTPENRAFDRIVRMAALSTGAQAAVMALSDADRIWFKARHAFDHEELDRGSLLCDTALSKAPVDVVLDAATEPPLAAHPLVAGEGFRFYAAAPLVTFDGYRIGSLCVLDRRKRAFPVAARQSLVDFAALLMELLELRLSTVTVVKGLTQALEQYESGGGREELFTICAWTKRIKIADQWLSFEEFLETRFDAIVSHGIHPDIADSMREDF